MQIEIDLNCIGNIQDVAKIMFPLVDPRNNKDIDLVLKLKQYNDLGVLIAIVSYVSSARRQGKIVRVHSSTNNSYLKRINFFKELNIDVEEDFMRHPSIGRFIEMKPFSYDTCNDIVNDISKMLDQQSILNDTVLRCFSYCICEILDNIRHSGVDIGYIVGQSYSKFNTTEIIFVDNGKGILCSLQENKSIEIKDDADALLKCIEKGFTCGSGGRGNGLYHTAKFIKENHGQLLIYSGESILKIHNKKLSVEYAPYWKGTYIKMVIKNKIDVDYNIVFDRDIPTSVDEFREELYKLW